MSSEFASLARDRHLLQEFCDLHVPSLLQFRSDPSFKLHVDDTLGNELRHLTTTSTCIESLLDCPPQLRPKDARRMAEDFSTRAIRRVPKKWKSEDSAGIYCRCRALPFVVRYLPRYNSRLEAHVTTILKQLGKTDRFALGEADPDVEQKFWYPPNAFHTFWFLRILEELKRFDSEFDGLNHRLSLDRRAEEMLLWARSIAGRQISLHFASSSSLDSDQLAWSLAILTRFAPDIQSNLANQDFIQEGFKSLFSKQTAAGTWQHGQPLFHYKYSGNAYCYVYETFTVLLKTVLEREKESEFLRAALLPFFPNLIQLWNYALVTQIQLPAKGKKSTGGKNIGWSSGHRIDHPDAEGWATASVFSYAQALRRLIGVWTREEAVKELNRVSTFATTDEADQKIVERGDTWPYPGSPAVAEQLVTLFVNPARKAEHEETLEPDDNPIQEQQARSAILFGPPGTSKTNLARAIAGAIGWQYVELHASHFVAEGLPAVQHTADNLFQRLMELDHTVILFDEIDELVRERDVEPDAFGRFLTTSMLPKLAELWKQRKVFYFIATNHIEYFDRAVTRAQRFDALIFVTPPSFYRKVEELKTLLAKKRPGVKIKTVFTLDEVDAVLTALECLDGHRDDDSLPEEHVLAKFIMLRWDQLDELAYHINDICGAGSLTVPRDVLFRALQKISDPRLQMRKTYCDYKRAGKYSIKDYSKDTVWHVENLPSTVNYAPPLSASNEKVWLTCSEPPEKIVSGGFSFEKGSLGRVRALPVRRKRKK